MFIVLFILISTNNLNICWLFYKSGVCATIYRVLKAMSLLISDLEITVGNKTMWDQVGHQETLCTIENWPSTGSLKEFTAKDGEIHLALPTLNTQYSWSPGVVAGCGHFCWKQHSLDLSRLTGVTAAIGHNMRRGGMPFSHCVLKQPSLYPLVIFSWSPDCFHKPTWDGWPR